MSKLMRCLDCGDIRKLTTRSVRTCECGSVAGYYNADGDTATVSEDAVLFGFCNHLLSPGRFSSSHIVECENAWSYADNWKITRLPLAEVMEGLDV